MGVVTFYEGNNWNVLNKCPVTCW